METSRLSFELALSIGNETRQDTWLGDDGHWGRSVREIFSLLDAMEFDGSQLLRLRNCSSSYFLWNKILKYHCQVASQSQSFYISNSREQWLRTFVQSPQPKKIFEEDNSEDSLIIHSNVVPRQAYIKVPCLNPQYCRGFVRASAIVGRWDIPSPHGCRNCALAEQLSRMEIGRNPAEDLDSLQRFWFLGVEEVEYVDDLGEESEAKVSKIRWRKGVFVRKRFNSAVELDRELDVALRVSHPNIVHCFGCSRWTDSTDYYLFMELLDVDLYRFLFEGSGTGNEPLILFRDLLDVLLQVAQAMKHLHEKNFVHGDLKPHNIFLSCFELAHSGVQYFLVKVGDFGCAQRVDSSGAPVGDFNFRIGSLRYTAPEVLRCRSPEGAVPLRCPQKIDVYSFGVVAYQVLTETPKLYDGCKSIAAKVIGGERPDLYFTGTLDADHSPLLKLIRKCWAPNPEDRPPFTEICAILDGHVDELQKKNAKRKHRSIGDSVNDCNPWSNRVWRREDVIWPGLNP